MKSRNLWISLWASLSLLSMMGWFMTEWHRAAHAMPSEVSGEIPDDSSSNRTWGASTIRPNIALQLALQPNPASIRMDADVNPATGPSSTLPGPQLDPDFYAATTLLFVNPAVGNDATGDGSQRSPLRSLTRALSAAQAGTVIVLSPGTYSEQSGEQFPIQLKSGVTVQGDPGNLGQGILIQGGGRFLSPTFASQDVALLGADDAVLMGVTVTNPNPRGYGLWVESTSPSLSRNTFSNSIHDGVSITGDSRPTLQGNYFYRNGANGVTIYGTSQPTIQGNVFEETGFGINMGQEAAPYLLDNRVWNNRSGIVVQGDSRPFLRRNVVEFNTQDGLVAIAQSQPDLGLDENDPGQNRFSDNGQSDINAEVAVYPIIAVGNTLDLSRVVGQVRTTAPTTAPLTRVASLPTSSAPTSSAPTSSAPTSRSPIPRSAPTRLSPPAPVAIPPESTPVPQQRAIVAQSSTGIEPGDAIAAVSSEAPAFETVDSRSSTSDSRSSTSRSLDSGTLATASTATARMRTVASDRPADRDAQITDARTTDPLTADLLAEILATASLSSSSQSVNQGVNQLGNQVTEPSSSTASNAPQMVDDLAGETAIEIPIVLSEGTPASSPVASSSVASSSVTPSSANRLSRQATSRNEGANDEGPSVASATSTASVSSTSDLPLLRASTAADRLPSVAIAPNPDGPARSQPSARTAATAAPVPPSNLLPVPGILVPEGHLGNLSTLPAQETSFNTALLSTVPFTPTSTRRVSLRYRVLAKADTYEARTLINTLVPDAFFTQVNGQSMMQIGAYRELENANDIAYQLVEKGLQVEVQRINE